MHRIYELAIEDHFVRYEQAAFVTGPRQVGKTTLSKHCCDLAAHCKYLNWDKVQDREIILSGNEDIITDLPVDALLQDKPLLVLDEIHKYSHWKQFLKGFIDDYKGKLNILVTGSAKLNVYKRGGDSLTGRYFLYRIHPLSVAELTKPALPSDVISNPRKIDKEQFDALFEFGGFPEPYLKQEKSFYNRWQELRQQQVLREDIRDAAKIHELALLEVLASLLRYQVGGLAKYSELAKKVRVSDTTIRRWIQVLESFYYCFKVKPWSTNISRSLIKEPKIFLWDWSLVEDKGARVENFIACHLLKAVHFWTDMGFGKYELYFVRDKDKREVDFLLVKDYKPWILVEVKTSAKEPLNKHLELFQSQIKAEHAFQVVFDLPYVEQDCMKFKTPKIIPAITFLSQLI